MSGSFGSNESGRHIMERPWPTILCWFSAKSSRREVVGRVTAKMDSSVCFECLLIIERSSLFLHFVDCDSKDISTTISKEVRVPMRSVGMLISNELNLLWSKRVSIARLFNFLKLPRRGLSIMEEGDCRGNKRNLSGCLSCCLWLDSTMYTSLFLWLRSYMPDRDRVMKNTNAFS